MSDVIVSTTESTTNVTTVNDVTTIAITDTVVDVSQATAGLQGIPGTNSDGLFIFVRNATGALLSKGTIVYVSNANGTHVQVTPAIATGDSTSARTVGWLSEDIANNASGLCQIEGYLEGINTGSVNEGDQLYLSGTTAGAFTNTKPQAPVHLVYVGVCAKKSSGNGKVFVKVQNGYELDELHNVQIISIADKNVLQYDSASSLWKNVAATAITAGSALTAGTAFFASTASTSVTAGTASYATTSGTAVYATTSGTSVSISGSITRSQVSDYASGTVANITGSITRSQVSNFTSGTVAVAGVSSFSDESGTALYATNAGYATTSGTAVSISGSITRSQVSDYASGTVANISGTVTQSQVTNLTTDLAGKANLSGGNSFVDAQIISASTATQIPLQVRAGSAVSVNVQEWDNSAGAVQASVDSNFRGNFPRVTAGSSADLGYAILSVNTGATANKGIVVRSVASQSVNSFEIQDSTGATAIAVNNVNSLLFGTGLASFLSSNGRIFAQASSTAIVPLTVRGAASQSANLQEWQTSSGSTALAVNSAGLVNATRAVTVTQINTGEYYLRLAGIASQTGDFLQVNDPSANPLFRIASTGAVTAGGTARLGQVTVLPASTATVGVVVQGLSGQSANLQEWQNSGGTVTARVAASGSILGQTVQTISGSTILREGNSGGVLEITKSTAQQNLPGVAGIARFYLRDGTNAGTLKLVVRAGTAGVETTIFDNIGQ